MSFYNTLVQHVFLPLGDALLKTDFTKRVSEIRAESKLNEGEINALQHQRLKATLTFATSNSAYYKKLAISPQANPIAWLKQFPILDKQTLNANVDAILTQPKEKLIKNASSGSSGVQTVGYYSQDEMDTFRAIQTVFWEWGGYQLGDKIIQTGMGLNRSRVKKLKDKLLRTEYSIAFNPNKQEVEKVFKKAMGSDYSFLGYASSLYVYAKIAEELKLDGPKFKSAICWGDKLFDHYREAVKKQFGCEVYETYGAAEGFQMAGQKDLKYMYMMAPQVYMEILDDNGNEVADGELGHVIVTNLRTTAMPMIRYRIGDLAVKLPRNKYPEKRDLALPLLERVVGRDTDIVITPNNHRLIVHTFTGVFEYYTEVKQFRIIQHQKESLDIEYIVGDNFNVGVLEQISSHLRKVINDDSLTWKFIEVTEIPNTPSGKPQIIKSLLPKSTLQQ
jgi:phenylacetate-CoA ligase